MSKLIESQEATYTIELTQTEVDLIKALLGRVSYSCFGDLGLSIEDVWEALGHYRADMVVTHNGMQVTALEVRNKGEIF